ncbi:MAG: trypsin-like serine protease [Deltaproteobacteria bacterium]|nr:trypsin-like serine protease [Deltaproteobacteria bacterium]
MYRSPHSASSASASASASALNAFAFLVFLGVLSFGVLPGCVHEVEESSIQLSGEVADARGAVIVGGVNWQDVTSLAASSDERVNANAVGYLSIPARGSRCTAFLVANDLVMTNHHCISSSSQAVGATVSFRREAGVDSSNHASYSCDTFIGANDGLDYSLLRCLGNPGDVHGVLNLDEGTPRTDDSIYILHQNCDYYQDPSCERTKKISRGNIISTGTELRYNADTLGGSSGSPVFDASSHDVIGLHHVGIGSNSDGRGWANSAVRIGRIVDHIESHWPDLVLGATSVQPAPVVPVSSDDEFEPNNERNAATDVENGDVLSDLNIAGGDKDIFRLELSGAATVSVSLSFIHGAGDIDAAIYIGGSETAIATGVSPDDNEQIVVDVVSGPAFIVVYGYNGATNDYSITFDVDGQTEPVEPPGEVPSPSFAEPNDSPAAASTLPLPGSASGVAIESSRDVDFYRIQHAGGALLAQLDFSHSVGDLDLDLYTAGGTRLERSESITDQELITGSYPAGDYLLRVIGYGGATGEYSLIVEGN